MLPANSAQLEKLKSGPFSRVVCLQCNDIGQLPSPQGRQLWKGTQCQSLAAVYVAVGMHSASPSLTLTPTYTPSMGVSPKALPNTQSAC